MTIVSNTSPITNLAAVGQLDLLQQLYGNILIPQAVYDEMVGIGKTVPGAVEVQTLSWIQTQPVTDSNQVAELQQDIHLGEAEAIVLALELGAELLIIDDRRGRVMASQCGLRVTGVMGVLLEAKSRELIPAVKPVIDQLIEQVCFRVSSQLYADVLQAAGE